MKQLLIVLPYSHNVLVNIFRYRPLIDISLACFPCIRHVLLGIRNAYNVLLQVLHNCVCLGHNRRPNEYYEYGMFFNAYQT